MRGVLRVVGVFRVVGMLRVVRMVWMLPILGWPLLAAPGQPGRTAKRMLLDLHAPMVAVRVSIARAAKSDTHHIRVAITAERPVLVHRPPAANRA